MPRELKAYLCKMQFQLILVVQLLQKAQACLSETFLCALRLNNKSAYMHHLHLKRARAFAARA